MVAYILGIAVVTGARPLDQAVDGKAAIEIAKRFAHSVGYSGKLSLSSVSSVDGKRWGFGSGTYQAVTLTLPDKRWITAYVSPTGSLQLFQAVQPGAANSRGVRPTSKTSVIVRAGKLIQIVRATGEYHMRDVQVGLTDPYAMVYFDVTVAGRHFFNLNPTFAYRVDFNTSTGELTYYSPPPSIPAVEATLPQISAAKAMSLLEHWGKTHYRTVGGVAYLYGPTWRYTPSLVPELGYYNFKNEAKARLVWQAHVWMPFNGRAPSVESGLLKMYVDAVTGELVMPDDEGIG